MDWIPAHKALAHHPKLKRLQRILGVEQPTAIGHMMNLWWWATDYCKSGHLNGYNESDIADAAEWSGDTDTFYGALVDCSFINQTDDGDVLHDWEDWAGKYLYQREKDAERKRRWKEGTRTERGGDADGTRRADVEEKKEKEEKKKNICPASPDEFASFWTLYPRKESKGTALRAWGTACKKANPPVIVAGLRAQLSELQSREKQFQPLPATWLNGERWADENGNGSAAIPPGKEGVYEDALKFFRTDMERARSLCGEDDRLWVAVCQEAARRNHA